MIVYSILILGFGASIVKELTPRRSHCPRRRGYRARNLHPAKVGSPTGIRTPIRSSRGCSPTVERPGYTRILNHFAGTAKRRAAKPARARPTHAHRTTPALQSPTAVQGVAMPTSGTFSGTSVETGYAEMARRPLEAEQCALIVVDIQEKLLPPIWERERLLRNAQLLIRLAGILKIPSLVTVQYAKGLGNTVPDIVSMLPDTPPIDKLTFSCFGSDVFCSLLKRLPRQRTTVLLCGMETHVCVMQTALGALRDGYLVHVASDAVSSRTELNWRIGLDRMRAAGAILSSTEMMIYELLRSSGTPAFRELLPYLKG